MIIKLESDVEFVLNTLISAGFDAYIVGGCVRDFLLKSRPHDFDVTTNAHPLQVISLFKDFNIIRTGEAHGTVGIITPSQVIEVTTYRIDGKYSDNRHPDQVIFSNDITEDLSRRDFTMNAIAYNRNGFIDPFSGSTDIKNHIIRCVGEPNKRFLEDALRILRALRFSSTLGFTIDNSTKCAIHTLKSLIENIARERIFGELKKLLLGKNAYDIIFEYLDVFSLIIKDLGIENVKALKNAPVDLELRFALLLDNIAPLRVLKADTALIRQVSTLLSFKCALVPNTKRELKHLISQYGFDMVKKIIMFLECQYNICLKDLHKKTDDIKESGCCLTLKELSISGRDLIALGLPPGEKIGYTLSVLLSEVIDDRLPNEKKPLLKKAAEILQDL